MSYNLGDYVELKGKQKRKGYIRYDGSIDSVGDCYGIQLDTKDDTKGTDGSVDGQKYFQCKQGYGIFIKKTRIKGIINANTSSPPAINTEINNNNNNNNTKNSKKKNPSNKPKKRRNKSPQPNGNHKDPPQLTHNSTPRPRLDTRDPRPLSLKKPGPTTQPKKASNISKKKQNKSSKQNEKLNKYPKDGNVKQKLTFIFNEINSMNSSNSKTHRRTTTEISKNKADLIKKATIVIMQLNNVNQDNMSHSELITPLFIIKNFKKIFELALKDKKFSVHKAICNMLNALILCTFTRHGMSEQLIFLLKHLTNQLTHNNTKSVNIAKESIKTLINEILYEDNTKLTKIIINELLRYCKTSKKKIIRKYCWMFTVQILETKYRVQPKKQLKPPNDVINKNNNNKIEQKDEEKKEEKKERVMKKRNKPPKSMMDALGNGLKQGLSDKDKEVQVQAMKVLSLFSLLEEPKADRLIAKMSTSTRKLFHSKYGVKDGSNKKLVKKRGKKIDKKSKTMKVPKSSNLRKKSPGRKVKSSKKSDDKKRKKSFSLKEDPALSKENNNTKINKKIDDKKNKKKMDKKGNKKKIDDKKGKKKTDKKVDKKLDKDKKKGIGGKKKKGGKKKGNKKSDDDKKVQNESHSNGSIVIEQSDSKKDIDIDEQLVSVEPEPEITNAKYDMNSDEDNNVNMGSSRRRKKKNGKDRNTGTFGTGDDMGFDMNQLGGLLMDDDVHSGSGSDRSDSGDDDDNNNKQPEPEVEPEPGDGSSAGMNGDVRKDADGTEEYSSSTETYEGDNDIEIYEFPRKDVLSGDIDSISGSTFEIDINKYLAFNNPEYNWKFGNEEMIFFSHKYNTHLLMSRISQIDGVQNEKDYDDSEMKWINKLLDYSIDYSDLSLIKDTEEFWPTDLRANYIDIILNRNGMGHGGMGSMGMGMMGMSMDDDEALYDNPDDNNIQQPTIEKHSEHSFICSTQISYNLMRLLTNEHGSDWIKQFIESCIYEITVHALCVFHPLSNGNVYHGRVILEVLLNHFPGDFFKYLVSDTEIIQPLLKYAIFNNIHHGNLNSFVMDLICFDPESIQQRDDIISFNEKSKMIKECFEYKQILLYEIFTSKWNFIETIIARSLNKYNDNISTKYSVFFVDLVARCASIEQTKCLFSNCQNLIIDSFVNGLLGQGKIGKNLNYWQRIRCGQSLVEYLDLASRPTIMDPSIASTPFGFMQQQNAYKENIFYPTFKYCLSRLIHYINDLCLLIIEKNENENHIKSIKLSYDNISKPLGRLKLNALELLTVTIDFHEMNCALVLKQIPLKFWDNILDMALTHKYNNMFLCHFRRLVHLAMIFRRRILKHLCTKCNMIDRMVKFYQNNKQRSELHGYILQMLNDIYCHDSEIKHIQ